MKRNLLELYALAVCFFTVACFAIALGVGLYASVGIANPSLTINSVSYSQHQTNDAYWASCGGRFCTPDDKKKEKPTEVDLTKQREESFDRVLANERRDATQTVIKTMIVVLIDLAIFLFHWVVARRARNVV